MQYKLSVVLVIYEMKREIERTLYTLSPMYQQVPADDYEVIIMDNGSKRPLPPSVWSIDGMNIQYHHLAVSSPSPSQALNLGIERSKGRYISLMIDGARMLSPGILKKTFEAFSAFPNPFVTTIGFHLGFEIQQVSQQRGYSLEEEDLLLDSIDWRQDGYRLFQISCFSGSCKEGWFGPISESNFFTIHRSILEDIGGMNEDFDLPGGGLVNLDLFKQITELADVQTVRILGEGTFHQYHGGATTQNSDSSTWDDLLSNYEQVTGSSYTIPSPHTHVIGQLNPYLTFNYHSSSFAQRKSREEEIRRHLTGKGIIILGMHRSGTSMLTGCLQEAGLFLGDVIVQSPHNIKGNRENRTTWMINDHVLSINGGRWDHPVPSPVWNDRSREIRDFFLSRFFDRKIWGFKDPRTLLTLTGWLEVIPAPFLVGIFRHPFLVAASLFNRNNISYDDGLQLWLEYNWRLMYFKENRDLKLIEFSSDIQKLSTSIKLLSRSIGLTEVPNQFSFISEHSVKQDIPIIDSAKADQCLALYRKMQQAIDF